MQLFTQKIECRKQCFCRNAASGREAGEQLVIVDVESSSREPSPGVAVEGAQMVAVRGGDGDDGDVIVHPLPDPPRGEHHHAMDHCCGRCPGAPRIVVLT
jgi:hypothetical protein